MKIFFLEMIITTNDKGDIIVYSISNKKIYLKYNFYKKFKNIKKLNLTIKIKYFM